LCRAFVRQLEPADQVLAAEGIVLAEIARDGGERAAWFASLD